MLHTFLNGANADGYFPDQDTSCRKAAEITNLIFLVRSLLVSLGAIFQIVKKKFFHDVTFGLIQLSNYLYLLEILKVLLLSYNSFLLNTCTNSS